MARDTRNTTEIYRTMVKYHWRGDEECLDLYGPYGGPSGKGQARRRIKDQYNPDLVIEGKVQKLEARLVFDENLIITGAKLEWVDVDDSR